MNDIEKKSLDRSDSKFKKQKIFNPFTRNDGQVVKELKNLYKNKINPIENDFLFNKFNHSEILDSELHAKPTVLLVGQYSTGKTSFIKSLIGCDYPGIHIGPEPTTDKFVAVVYGDEPKTILGNAATGIDNLPFSGLSRFGTSFLSKFTAATVPAPLLKNMNIIDTPGVLSGEKQRLSRGYDFSKVSKWFAERSDLILLMFDCSKLDISDELKSVIEELQPYEDKVHCVLNKADQLDSESLMRVYGALLWSMGRIFKGAEVTRVYVGSFCEGITINEMHNKLFEKDKAILLEHLNKLPSSCSMRKINEMVKRVRLLIVQACILGNLKSKMPFLFGKEAAQNRLTNNLKDVFDEVKRNYQLAEGDFPKVEDFRASLLLCDFSKFPATDRNVLNTLQSILTEDIPRITKCVANVEEGISGEYSEETDEITKIPSMFKLGDDNGEGQGLSAFLIGFALLVALMGIVIAFVQMNPQHKLAFVISSVLSNSKSAFVSIFQQFKEGVGL